jgi:carboxymethylenebutenolidase
MSEQAILDMTPEEQKLTEVFQEHSMAEFVARDPEAALSSMVDNPYVMNFPILKGGVGKEAVRAFYSKEFIPQIPSDVEVIPVTQTAGQNRLIIEGVMRFTHSIQMDWVLPGVAPTNKRIELIAVAVIEFQDGKVACERLYWDQASVLAQVGLIDATNLPVKGAECAQEFLKLTGAANG